jgi:hypothetical protein
MANYTYCFYNKNKGGQMEVQLSFRKVGLKEIKFKDMVNLDSTNKSEVTKQTIRLGSDLTDEEYFNLSIKDGIILTKGINELNGFDVDFLKP